MTEQERTALPLTAPVTDGEIDAAFSVLDQIREFTTVDEVRRMLEGFAAGRDDPAGEKAPALPLTAPASDEDVLEYCDTHPGASFFDAVVALEGFAAGRTAGVEDEPVAQWQKKHPYRTDGRWQNTDEHDARWWVTNSMGWEMRALYAAPQPPVGHQPKPSIHAGSEVIDGDLNTTHQPTAPADRKPRLSLTEIDALARVYTSDYASPHHITFTVDGLRSLIEAASGISRP